MSLYRAQAKATLILGLILLLQAAGFGQTAGPVLRFKSIFSGSIWRSDVDAGENYVVVSNAYDSVSTWALDLPSEANAIRVPILDEQRKRAHAVALSPSAELVAYSTPPLLIDQQSFYQPYSSRIYIARRSTGEIVRVLDGPTNEIQTRPQGMRFSPDGAHLAAVLSSGCGLRVWSTKDWRLVAKDDENYGGDLGQNECCLSNAINDCDARPDSNSILFYRLGTSKCLVVTSSDTGVHTYLLEGDELTPIAFAPAQSIDLSRPAGLSISPSGDYIVVGDRGSTRPEPRLRFRVAVLDRATLKPIRRAMEVRESSLRSDSYLVPNPATGDLGQFHLDRVALLREGQTDFIFAGTLPCHIVANIPEQLRLLQPVTEQQVCLVRWAVGQGDETATFIPVGTNLVSEIIPLAQRRGILVVAQDVITLLASDGLLLPSNTQHSFVQRNPGADFRGGALQFAISADAKVIRFTDYRISQSGQQTVSFSLSNFPNPLSPPNDVALFGPDQDRNIVENWNNSRTPFINAHSLPAGEISKDEVFRSVSVLQDRNIVLLGSSENLRLLSYSDTGISVLCRLPITAEAFRVNLNRDGSIAVTAHSDGTVRWHRITYQSGSCNFRTMLTVQFSQLEDGTWTWTGWLPDGTHAQDFASRDGLEWQLLTSSGSILLTPFDRLQGLYSPARVSGALDFAGPISQGVTTVPDPSRVQAGASPGDVIEILPNPPSAIAYNETIHLGLRVADTLGWPKRVRVVVNNTQTTIYWKDQRYLPSEPLLLTPTELQEGRLEIGVVLPTNARTAHADFQICFLVNDAKDACKIMLWNGDIARPSQRRLWGVFIGLSRYADPSINLRFAENDVIDLARLFVSDFEEVPGAVAKSDRYQELHLDLAVAASPQGQAEIAQLTTHSYVKTFDATKIGILSAIRDIINLRAAEGREEESDDLFVFYFSGHGVLAPVDKDLGRVLLSTVNTKFDAEDEQVEKTTINSTDLFDLLEQVPGRKVIVFDACRSLLPFQHQTLFDPHLVVAELHQHALSADIFFSSGVGQFSREVSGLAFDLSRPKERQGNGLFSYALLHALSTDATVPHGAPPSNLVDVHVFGLAEYLETVFFNPNIPDSEASKLMKLYNWKDIQTPAFYPTRKNEGDPIVRSFINASYRE